MLDQRKDGQTEAENPSADARAAAPGDGGSGAHFLARLSAWRDACLSHFVSVRIKVVALMTAVGMALVLMSGAFVIYNFNSNLERGAYARSEGVADAVAHAALNAAGPEQIAPVIAAVAGAPGLDGAAMATLNGRVRFASHDSWLGKRIMFSADLLGEARRQAAVKVPAQDELEGAGHYQGDFIRILRFESSGEEALLFVRVDMESVASDLIVDAWNLMAWLVIAVILAVLSISLLIHRIIVTPIEALRDYAASGSTAALQAVGPNDEIGAVARALSESFSARRAGEARIESLAATDGLTGLGNRMHFKTRLAEEISSGERGGRMVGVMVLNLDNFKDVNDTISHDAGDIVLQRTADILKGCARDGDTVARIGGDEFGVIMPGVKSADDALQLASRLVRAVGAPFRLGTQDLQQGACVGLTLYPQDGRDADVLVKTADLALSRAKQEGAGACVLYRHELHLRAIERNTIERDLRTALAQNQLMLFYQPKVDIETGRVTGAEALIRWRHEDRGFIPPATFIPVAERSGLVVPLTKWVLDEACRQNRVWQDDGLMKIGVAVNVSAIDLRRTDLTDTIANTLIRRGLSPRFLELEVTESMVMEDVDVVIGTLRRLRSLGVGISIDDFGTGYSSLAYLKRFPVKRIKIDRSFVQDVADGRDGNVIPKVIIDLAHALGVKVIAEGVETAEQYEALRALGCDEVQGYFVGRPMPAAEFEVFLRNSPAGGLQGAPIEMSKPTGLKAGRRTGFEGSAA
ncbi:putative bifunctional diguanylate cyclase/phosphodiesterase [Parvibaculum sp.]|uniref:putative bifunctional diguanylate cyclase/phosphodiesterase n=1 Tax=Parvibaculum sp. TaxID=2024848 RepID=UPI00391C3315